MHTFDHIHQCENSQLLSYHLTKTKVWSSHWWSFCRIVICQMVLVYCFRKYTPYTIYWCNDKKKRKDELTNLISLRKTSILSLSCLGSQLTRVDWCINDDRFHTQGLWRTIIPRMPCKRMTFWPVTGHTAKEIYKQIGPAEVTSGQSDWPVNIVPCLLDKHAQAYKPHSWRIILLEAF